MDSDKLKSLNLRYTYLLKTRGLRATGNRSLILAILDDPRRRMAVGDLVRYVRAIEPSYLRTSINNAVRELGQVGLLRYVLVRKQIVLDGWQEPHHNLVCRDCGYLKSVPLNHIDTRRIKEYLAARGHHLSGQGLDIEVLCRSCFGKGGPQ